MRKIFYFFSCWLILFLLFSQLVFAIGDRVIEEGFQRRFMELASEIFHHQRIEQYGYRLFERPLEEFEALTHLPISPDYVLGPGDTLIIRLSGNKYAEYELELDRDGFVSIPDLAPINLRSLTPSRAREELQSFVNRYLSGVTVNLTMGELRSISVYVIGEVNRPGIHELSNLSTAVQALFAARGPTRLGSLREIRVLRDRQIISSFDFYDFLLEGRLDEDLRLQDNDVVFVPTVKDLVAIGGEVKRPGIYESIEDMRLSHLLEMAGGLTPTAFLRTIKVERIQDNEEMILLELNAGDLETFIGSKDDIFLQDSDLVFIDTITTHRMPERQAYVTITGNIARPGDFQLLEGMTLKDLVLEAGGYLPETMLHRAEIWRFISSETRQILPIVLEKALQEEPDPEHNLELVEWDLVRIYAEYDILPEKIVSIRGEVNKPGNYRFIEGMTLRDLLFRGHEPTEDAYLGRAELFRYRQGELREVVAVDLESLWEGHFDMLLESGDLLQVYPLEWVLPEKKVHVMGAVQDPGTYELYKDMKLGDLLFTVGGLKDNAYLERAEVLRLRKDKFREVISVNLIDVLSGEGDVELLPEDILQVYRVEDVYPVKKVRVSGAVNEPGDYELYEGMKLGDLLFSSGGLEEDAYLERAELYRFRTEELREVISIDLSKVTKGEDDLNLEQGDHLQVYTVGWIFPSQEVHIHGAINEPGTYEIYKDMSLSDLIFQAGGLKKEAYLDLVEVYRSHFGSSEGLSLITRSIRVLEENICGTGVNEDDLILKEGDRVYIRSHITDQEVKRITILGEVSLPGEYILLQKENLSSVIDRAGGLTSMAYPFGAIFTRDNIKRQQAEFIEDFVNYQQQKISEARLNLAQLSLTTLEREERSKELDHQERVLELMLARLPKGRIIFDLVSALEDPDSFHNIVLQHKDQILIPARPQVVLITGEVFNPEAIIYEPGRDKDFYLSQVGGVTSRADKDGIYILKANGRVENEGTRFSPLQQGDMIVVPPIDLGRRD